MPERSRSGDSPRRGSDPRSRLGEAPLTTTGEKGEGKDTSAPELAASLARLEQQHHLLSVLYQVYGEMNAAPELDQAMGKLLDYAQRESGATAGLVGMLDEEAAVLEIRARAQAPLAARVSGNTIDLLSSPLRPLIGEWLSIHAVTEDGPVPPVFAGSRSQLLVPVMHGGSPVALLILESTLEDAFAKLDPFLIEKLAEQAGTVLSARKFLERSKKAIDLLWDVGAVSDASHELDQSELDELLAKMLEIALQRLGVRNGIILLADEDTGDLIIESRALRGDFIRKPPFRLKRRSSRPSGISFWVVDNNKPYVTGDISGDPNYVPLLRGIRSNITVPIPFQDRAIGAIALESVKKDAFGEADVRVLEELARQAAKFVRRAQLYRKTREMDQRGIMIRGLCREWEEAEELIERVSNTNATVLLRGESGTGKELIANAIHFNSKRSRRQFVVVNCAAIPGDLLESELFGHAKGAFTGATYARVGEFEKADGGTLFLDEIGDLTLPLQVKVLRALQTGDIAKIGGNEAPRKVDVRVIAATNRDLEGMMKEGRFREDLYYRLNVVPIWLPPLRKFRESIPGMVQAFVTEANRLHGRKVKGIDPAALALLCSYGYPGNVRELRNVIERSVIVETGALITTRALPPEIRGEPFPGAASAASTTATLDYKAARRAQLEQFEDRFLRDLLVRSGGSIQKAAKLAGINRVNLHKMLARRGIAARMFKS